jgi:hypothetical protein
MGDVLSDRFGKGRKRLIAHARPAYRNDQRVFFVTFHCLPLYHTPENSCFPLFPFSPSGMIMV